MRKQETDVFEEGIVSLTPLTSLVRALFIQDCCLWLIVFCFMN